MRQADILGPGVPVLSQKTALTQSTGAIQPELPQSAELNHRWQGFLHKMIIAFIFSSIQNL
jgi:hypothetical protein